MEGGETATIRNELRKDNAEKGIRVLLVIGKGTDEEGNMSCLSKMNVEIAALLDRNDEGRYTTVIFPGKGYPNTNFRMTEAEVMLDYAVSLGMNPAKTVLEKKSVDTIGTIYYVDKELLSMMGNVSSITVVACDYHMERVQFICNKFFYGRYRLEFIPVNTHLPMGAELSAIRAAELMRLERDKVAYGMIKDGDFVGMRKWVETSHAIYSKKKVKE